MHTLKTKNAIWQINYQGALAIVIALIIGTIFSDTALTYITTWLKFDESMGHALIIVAMVIFYLLKPNKIQNNKTHHKWHWLILIPICLLSILHQVSAFLGLLVFQQFSLYFLWLLAIYFILGSTYFKQNLFPLLFFLFAVPFWEFLNPIFLSLTTVAVTYFLDFIPVIAFIDGDLIELPYGMLQIAGGCSGLRYFEVAFALAVFAVYAENFPLRLKLLIVIVAIALGILSNWIRVISLIYVGYDSQMTSELMNDHETHGLILFMLVITPLIFFINWLSARYSIKTIKHANLTKEVSTSNITKVYWMYFSLFLFCTISIALIFNINSANQSTSSFKAPINSTTLHPTLTDYGQYSQTVTQYNNCELIVRNYQFTDPGTNALPFNHIYNKKSYGVINSTIVQVPSWPTKIKANQLTLKNKNTEQEVTLYYWYQYDNMTMTNRYIAKLLEIIFIFNRNTHITINAISCA